MPERRFYHNAPWKVLSSYYLITSFVLAYAGFQGLSFLSPRVFMAFYRMPDYANIYPAQYLALVSVVYTLIAVPLSLWGASIEMTGRKRFLIIVGIMTGTLILASPLGGILITYHSYVNTDSNLSRLPRDYWKDVVVWGAQQGFLVGALVPLFSFSYSIPGLIIGYFVTGKGFELAERSVPSKAAG